MRNKLKQLFFEAEDCLEQGNISLGIKKYIAALNEAQKNSCEEYLALTYLGMAHGEAGDYTRAIECMKRSQEVALALYDADGVPYAVAVSNEGMIHNHRGRLKDAERFLDQAVAILRTAKRPMPPELRETMRAQTAIVYSNGADCKAKLGKASEALALMRSAYNSAKLTLPPGDSLRVQLGLELGVLLHALGHTREVRNLFTFMTSAMVGNTRSKLRSFWMRMRSKRAMYSSMAKAAARRKIAADRMDLCNCWRL